MTIRGRNNVMDFFRSQLPCDLGIRHRKVVSYNRATNWRLAFESGERRRIIDSIHESIHMELEANITFM